MRLTNLFSDFDAKFKGFETKLAPVIDKVDTALHAVAPFIAGLPPQIAGPFQAVVMGIDAADRFALSKVAARLPPAAPEDLHAVAVFRAGEVLALPPAAMALLPALVQSVYEALKQIKAFHDARVKTEATAPVS